MRRLKTIPALLFVILLALAFLLTPQSWVDAATGRLSELRATTLELTSGRALLVGIANSSGTQSSALDDMATDLNEINTDTDSLAALDDLPQACDSTAAISISTTANNEIVPIASGEVITVCNIVLISRGTVAVQAIYGTGTACDTGETNLSGPLSLKIDGTQPPGFSGGNGDGTFFVPAGKAFCLELSDAIQVDGWISYAQYTP